MGLIMMTLKNDHGGWCLGTCKDSRGSHYDQKHRILKACGASQLINTEKLD